MTNPRLYIPVIGRIIIAFIIMTKGRKRYIDTKFTKIPYWKRELTSWQIFKVNAKIAWRRFDVQTRGMGLILVLILGMLIIISLFSFIGFTIVQNADNSKYSDALKTSCQGKQFYSWNFRSCENVDVRPLQPQTPPATPSTLGDYLVESA